MGHEVTNSLLPKLDYKSPDELEFDPENPRFGGLVSHRSQDAIREYLYGAPHYASELVDSLVENGFIHYEPLVVKRKDSRLVVIEGNRRLAAIKQIRANLDKYPHRKNDLDSIPVLIFPTQAAAQQDIRVYLGVRHLLGIREWPPLSKAMFLERESKAAPGGLDHVLKEVRLTKQQARRFLTPFRLLKSAGAPLPPGEDFWVLGEALQRSGIKKYLQLEVDPKELKILSFDKKKLKLLLDDLYGPANGSDRDSSGRLVHDTRELSELGKVLGSDRAEAELRRGRSLAEAVVYVDTREQSIVRLRQVNKQMSAIVRRLSMGRRDPDGDELQSAYKAFDTVLKRFLAKNA